jgi:microcystin-dependent protein
MTPYLAQIILLGFNFAPKGFAFCSGQLLPINQNQALFAILGTTYGGNGIQTFALPDLRGRVPVNPGQGPGLPNYVLGEVSGTQSTTLLASNLPLHIHPMSVNNGAGNSGSPSGNLLAKGPIISEGTNVNVYSTTFNTNMANTTIAPNGGNQPFSILQPYLTLNYSIALQGIFPSRN